MSKPRERSVLEHQTKVYLENGLIIPPSNNSVNPKSIKSYVSSFTGNNHLKPSPFIIGGKVVVL